jgi:hypothetical protein
MAVITYDNKWKVSMSDGWGVLTPQLQLVSIWDLLFYYDEAAKSYKMRANYDPAATNYDCVPFKLNHDVIAISADSTAKYDETSSEEFGLYHLYGENKYRIVMPERSTFDFDFYSTYGIDISLPLYDKKATPILLTKDFAVKLGLISQSDVDENQDDFSRFVNSLDSIFNDNGLLTTIKNKDFFKNKLKANEPFFKLFRSESGLMPRDSFEFYTRSPNYEGTGESWKNDRTDSGVNTWQDFAQGQTSKIAFDSDINFNLFRDVDIILCNEDRSFEQRFGLVDVNDRHLGGTDDDSGRYWWAFNGICMTPRNDKIFFYALKSILQPMLAANPKSPASLNIFSNLRYSSNFKSLFFDENQYETNGRQISPKEVGEKPAVSDFQKYLLQHAYVWVRAAFFADYVDPVDFNQSLNKDADVMHKNLNLGDSTSFDRYDKLFKLSNETWAGKDNSIGVVGDWTKIVQKLSEADEARRPYYPRTTPTIDIVSNEILGLEQSLYAHPTDREVSSFVELAGLKSADLDSNVGKVPTKPLNVTTDSAINPDSSESRPDDGVVFPLEDLITEKDTRTTRQPWFDYDERRQIENGSIIEDLPYTDFPIIYTKHGNLNTKGRIVSPTIDELWIAIKELAGGRDDDRSERPEGGSPLGSGDKNSLSFDTRFSLRKFTLATKEAGGSGNTFEKIGDPLISVFDYSSDSKAPFYVTKLVNDPNIISYKDFAELTELVSFVSNYSDEWKSKLIPSGVDDLNERVIPGITTPSDKTPSLRTLEAYAKGLRLDAAWVKEIIARWLTPTGEFGWDNDSNVEDETNNVAGTLAALHHLYDSFDRRSVYDRNYQDIGEQSFYDHAKGIGVKKLTSVEMDSSLQIVGGVETYAAHTVYLAADGTWRSTRQFLAAPITFESDEPF